MEYDVMTTPTKCLYMLLFIHALTHALTDSSLTHALTHPFAHSSTRSSTHLPTHPSIPLLMHSQFLSSLFQEFELLDYSLRSARIFFRADLTAEEEQKQQQEEDTKGGTAAEGTG